MKFSSKSLRDTLRPNIFFALIFVLSVPATLFAQKTGPVGKTLGSNHLTLEGSIGGTSGASQTSDIVGPGFNVLVGGGYRLNRRLSVLVEGTFDRSEMPDPVLQTAVQSDGSYRFWTVAANPIFHFLETGKYGGYVLGGGGYSHVVTSFSKPLTIDCSIYSGFGYTNFANVCSGKTTGSSFSSNQPMWDFGLGGDVRLFPSHREILFVEGRYMRMLTPAGQLPGANAALIPISVGVRW